MDDETKTFVNYAPDSRDPQKLKGGNIPAILEDRTGTFWLGGGGRTVQVRPVRMNASPATRKARASSSTIAGILEDEVGRL